MKLMRVMQHSTFKENIKYLRYRKNKNLDEEEIKIDREINETPAIFIGENLFYLKMVTFLIL